MVTLSRDARRLRVPVRLLTPARVEDTSETDGNQQFLLVHGEVLDNRHDPLGLHSANLGAPETLFAGPCDSFWGSLGSEREQHQAWHRGGGLHPKGTFESRPMTTAEDALSLSSALEVPAVPGHAVHVDPGPGARSLIRKDFRVGCDKLTALSLLKRPSWQTPCLTSCPPDKHEHVPSLSWLHTLF